MNSPNSQSLSKRVLEEAWISLLGWYGRSFEAQYGSIDGEQFGLWYAGLVTNGVTDEMVGNAIRSVPTVHAPRTGHPPNFADLLRLCTGAAAHDAVNEDRAFSEANAAVRAWDRHSWSSAAVYHAALAVGAWSLRHFPENITRPRFVDAYRKIVEQERAGEVLQSPPMPIALDHQISAPRPENEVGIRSRRERMAALSRALLELPPEAQKIATDALKSGRFVSPEVLLPNGVTASPASRAVLLEHCCNVARESQAAVSDEQIFFSAPSL
jgi:hypothetical protein